MSFHTDGANVTSAYVSPHANLVDRRPYTVITGMNASNMMNSLAAAESAWLFEID